MQCTCTNILRYFNKVLTPSVQIQTDHTKCENF